MGKGAVLSTKNGARAQGRVEKSEPRGFLLPKIRGRKKTFIKLRAFRAQLADPLRPSGLCGAAQRLAGRGCRQALACAIRPGRRRHVPYLAEGKFAAETSHTTVPVPGGIDIKPPLTPCNSIYFGGIYLWVL